ncbi:phage baseplate assembly protein V [Hymenobacter cheonanensis]|uniref:phage baseplate assembly protein V n=1 Tax=Hymenobacter sp. CA2-7 TaxID=3063993 RepID=UPI002712361B|nr:phage baseplate assembly protein V [Hymenobacter sp. CA2-7]MDO7883969.1 phage baseplate assembly protein V [Hymenobacter sp. CA2-7]
MASFPLLASGLVSFSVRTDGEELVGPASIYRILSITVDKGLNTISTATLTLIDGDPATGAFPVCDADTFRPGTAIDISAGYDNNYDLLFRGLVVGIAVSSQGAQGIQLTVSCKDEAVKMTGSRVVMPFSNQTTSDTLTQIIGTYANLSATIAATSEVQENLVQYNRTDWDFVVTQAEANGQVVINDNGQLTTVQLSTSDDDALALVYGDNVYSFSLDMDARTQFKTVQAQSWSAALQQDITVTAEPPDLETLGNLDPGQLAEALSQEAYVIRTAADVDEESLQTIANAYLAKRMLAMVKGSVEMQGSSAVLPGSMVRLDRIGARFSGRALVSKVTHTIAGGDWKTQLSLGTDEQPFAERHPDVVPPVGANSVASGVQGLYAGVVKALQPSAAAAAEAAQAVEEAEELKDQAAALKEAVAEAKTAAAAAADAGPMAQALAVAEVAEAALPHGAEAAEAEEEGEEKAEAAEGKIVASNRSTDNKGDFQVQVQVAALNNAVLWARLGQPSASSGGGMYFYPEVGDEVVLGFLGDDIRAPVILGSLYSKERSPAYVTEAANNIKAIVTRSKLTLEFDEQKGGITLKTPKNNHLIISDTAAGIVLKDQQGNTITLSDNGIDLVSKSNITITADESISLGAKMVTINGSAAVGLKGLDISADATGILSLTSNAASTLSSTAETVVKGILVRIN